jgi:hypothetical protein
MLSAPNCLRCANDITVFEAVVKSSNRYDQTILFLNKDSRELKTTLANKIRELKETRIKELLFYYTGHGLFKDDQFYYIPIDYSEKKHNITSLSNDELDCLIRTLTPDLTVKIVDACESAMNYIKTTKDSKEKYLQKTVSNFTNCYFMFSSLNSQSSYQNDKISCFTKAYILSLIENTTPSIRYKDIISYISDYFSENESQTPFFVNQANFTEIFIEDLLPVKESLKVFSDIFLSAENISNDINDSIQSIDIANNLLKAIKTDSEFYLSKEDALDNISKILEFLKNTKINEKLSDYYEMTIERITNLSDIKNISVLFDEIKKMADDFFINIYMEEEEYEQEIEVPKRRNLLGNVSYLFNMYQEYD